jgi:hypothetical protein
MPLQKSKELDNGITGNYWVITAISVDMIYSKSSFKVSMYLDSSSYTSGKTPVSHNYYEFNGSEFPFTLANMQASEMDMIALAYSTVAVHPDFSGAQVVA